MADRRLSARFLQPPYRNTAILPARIYDAFHELTDFAFLGNGFDAGMLGIIASLLTRFRIWMRRAINRVARDAESRRMFFAIGPRYRELGFLQRGGRKRRRFLLGRGSI